MTDAAAYPDDNPKTVVGMTKPSLSKFPASALIFGALAMMNGAQKYGAYNWRTKRVTASIYIDAAKRHLDAWFDSREELAPDSQIPHLGHALASIAILVDAQVTGNLNDDRPVAGKAAQLIEEWAAKLRVQADQLESHARSMKLARMTPQERLIEARKDGALLTQPSP